MCERSPFRRWLPHVLIEKIRNPVTELLIGAMATFFFFFFAVFAPALSFDMRVILALLTIPSFVVMMHGSYREDDC